MTSPCTQTTGHGPAPEDRVSRNHLRALLVMLPLVLAAWMGLTVFGHAEDRGIGDTRTVEMLLSRHGFREIDRIQRRGTQWVAEASAPEGRRIRAVVDASTGELTGRRPIDGSMQPRRIQK